MLTRLVFVSFQVTEKVKEGVKSLIHKAQELDKQHHVRYLSLDIVAYVYVVTWEPCHPPPCRPGSSSID